MHASPPEPVTLCARFDGAPNYDSASVHIDGGSPLAMSTHAPSRGHLPTIRRLGAAVDTTPGIDRNGADAQERVDAFSKSRCGGLDVFDLKRS